MQFINLINKDDRSVRLILSAGEISVDAEGRYFTLDFPYTLKGVSVSGDRILLLTEEYTEGKGNLYCYSYSGLPLFTGTDLSDKPFVSGSVMSAMDTVPLFSRHGIVHVADRSYFLATKEGGGMVVVDLTLGLPVLEV